MRMRIALSSAFLLAYTCRSGYSGIGFITRPRRLSAASLLRWAKGYHHWQCTMLPVTILSSFKKEHHRRDNITLQIIGPFLVC